MPFTLRKKVFHRARALFRSLRWKSALSFCHSFICSVTGAIAAGDVRCQEIFNGLPSSGRDRVPALHACAPRCDCEVHRTSEHSPSPVVGAERLGRFLFSPTQIGKSGKVKPTIWDYVQTGGCSVQREGIGSDDIAVNLVTKFLNEKSDAKWYGVYVMCDCSGIRDICKPRTSQPAIWVFDTALSENIAHAELFETPATIDDADWLEVRRKRL